MTDTKSRWERTVNNKQGSSLVVVIVAFAVLIIIGTALVGVVSYNHKNAMDYHKKQQAEYTARGVMQSIEKAFINPSVGGGQEMIEAVENAGPTGITGTGDITSANMGTYNVSLKLTSPDIIHAEVIANYQGMSYKLSAYFERDSRGNRLNPHDFIFFVKSGGVTFQSNSPNKTIITGNMYTSAGGTYEDTSIKGKLLNYGSTTFGNNSDLDGTLISITSTTVHAGASITGEVYYTDTSQVVFFDPATGDKTTKKEKISEVKLGISPYISTDQKKWSPIPFQYHLPSANFTLGGIKFLYSTGGKPESLPTGATQSGDTITLANGDVIDMQAKLYTSASGDTLNYTNPTSPILTLAPRTRTTNFSGNLTADRYDASGNISSPITFDTSGGDIHLYCSSNIDVNATTKIIGENNVYFHLGGNTMAVASGVTLGENDQTKHQLFIEGDGAKLDLKGTAKLKGSAYLDNGTYTETGNTETSGDKVLGSITAKTIEITRGNTYTYCDYFKEPDFNATLVKPDDNTPEDEGYFIYPPLAQGASAWTLANYSK